MVCQRIVQPIHCVDLKIEFRAVDEPAMVSFRNIPVQFPQFTAPAVDSSEINLIPFPDHNVYTVSISFIQLLSDCFQKSDHIAYISVFICNSHMTILPS